LTGNTGLQLPSVMGRNHGVLTNFSNNGNDAYVTGPDRLALNFDGSNDYVSFPAPASLQVGPTGFPGTWSIWVYRRASGGAAYFCENGFYCFNFAATTATIGVWGFDRTLSGLALNRWQHIALSFNGSNTIAAYLDGALQGTTTGTSAANFSTMFNFTIGARLSTASYLNGIVDDFIIFNAALTANEVRFIYEQGRGGGLLMQPPRRRSVAAAIAALVLACETANYSLTGQAAGLFASRVLAADQAQYILSGNAANTTASRLLSVDPASYTATGNDAATICARLLDGGAAAYALTGTDAGLIANRKLTADQAVYFLAGNNAELLRSLKLNAGSMALQLDNFAASLLADRKISADGAQYILVVSDANLGDSASGVAPYYYLFMLRGPQ
jgi:hypothetical protein